MPERRQADAYDLVLVGSSFASSFFLVEFLKHRPQARVLVLERGARLTHADHRRHEDLLAQARASYTTTTPEKPWTFRLAVGGASNCWVACAPRMTPEDFELRSRYGIAADWPIRYDDLEEFYCDAEDLMAVSGPVEFSVWPRSRPYPQPPHRLSAPDRLLQQHAPDLWCVQPCARPTRPTTNRSIPCCGTGTCGACPVDAKFTILNELAYLFDTPGVELRTGALAQAVDHAGGAATGVRWREDGREHHARADLVALGANAIFNPHLLLRSDLDGPEVGRGLVEQVSVSVEIDLDGVDNFGGSSVISANGFPLHDGPHRAERAAALIESFNAPVALRDLRGRWRQRAEMKVIFEDLRLASNRVTLSAADPDRPEVTFGGHSAYSLAGIRALPSILPGVLRGLPIEDLRIASAPNPSEAHIQGTTPMGTARETSVVDPDLRHHTVRNLLVLGASVFPTCPPANPTLTLCALSLRAARKLFE